MSETVRQTGKIVELDRISPTETLEEQCKRVLESRGKHGELESFYESYEEKLYNEYYEEYVVHSDTLYKVKDMSETDDYVEFFKLKKINGSDFEFDLMYYNGGCSFEEAIDEAFKGLDS